MRGGDIIIIDDPLKSGDAYSDSKRERVNDFYHNTLPSRFDDKQRGILILVMQMVHMNDLAGTLTILQLSGRSRKRSEYFPIGESTVNYRQSID
jgi:hypothetical protein